MKAEILGSSQDGGVPHLGCGCDTCKAAREDPKKQRSSASLRITDDEKDMNYIFDVSPDIRHHIGDQYIDGIFLSHAHLGHVTGLLYLGKESLNADNVTVHCSETVAKFLRKNPPYRTLIDRENIEIKEFGEKGSVSVLGLNIRPVQVKNEGYVTTDTKAFVIETDDTRLFYLSDIDEMTEDAVKHVESADVAIIDGCFWSRDEIERYENVPHPPIQESLELFEDTDTDIIFTHLNHTNPVLDPESEERNKVEEAGFRIAEDGMEIEL